MLKFRQKSASKVFGHGSTPPFPLENVQIQAEKKCLEQFGFGLDPPPLWTMSKSKQIFFREGFPYLVNYEAVYRTAPATPGMLNI